MITATIVNTNTKTIKKVIRGNRRNQQNNRNNKREKNNNYDKDLKK